ncbi:hypothetical protein ACJJTC_010131 [Scirpophaga incertulas]
MATVREDTIEKVQIERTLIRRRFSNCANKLEGYIQKKDTSQIQFLEIYAGVDGLCRVARIKTANWDLIRPLQRLFPLEVSVSKESDQTVESEDVEPSQSDPYKDTSPRPDAKVTRTGRLVKIPRRLDL